MNTLKLNAILQQFIDNFDYLSAKDGGDEGYKWVAAYCFKQNWNIEAEDFLAMFNDSMKEMSNLIDNSQVQPLSGIRLLLKQPEEVEFVRNSFKELFSDDNGDIAARQDRVDAFVESVNDRIAKYTPEGSWRYNQSRGNVIDYLNLWRPHENYIYKATEANEWAACVEFGEDFGSGTTFSLAKYYKMCDELLDAVGVERVGGVFAAHAVDEPHGELLGIVAIGPCVGIAGLLQDAGVICQAVGQ